MLDFDHRLLSAAEERRLLSRYRRCGDRAARDKVVEHNLRLVLGEASREVARRKGCAGLSGTSQGARVSVEDLVQEGILGLLKAAEGFDPERGFRFSTFAVPFVRRAISDAIWDASAPVKLPEWERKRVRRYLKAARSFEALHSRPPTEKELAMGLRELAGGRVEGLPEGRVRTAGEEPNPEAEAEERAARALAWVESVARTLRTVSYSSCGAEKIGEAPAPRLEGRGSEGLRWTLFQNGEDAVAGQESWFFDGLADGVLDQDAVGEAAAASADVAVMLGALGRLETEDRELLAMRYGLEGFQAHSLNRLCEIRGCYKSNVITALSRAHARLREAFARELLGEEVPTADGSRRDGDESAASRAA